MTHGEMRGALASALHRGADVVYFFNLFTGPYQRWPRADHDRLIADAGSLQELLRKTRRHALSLRSPWAQGEPAPAKVLPVKAGKARFRLHSGPRPGPEQIVFLELVLSPDDQHPQVHINGVPCSWSDYSVPQHIQQSGWKGAAMKPRHRYSVPHDALYPGYNLVRVDSEESIEIGWVEISIHQVGS